MPDPEAPAGHLPQVPAYICGLPVIAICSDCDGEGVLWSLDENELCQAERCSLCNCVGYLLDAYGPKEDDEEALPF